MNYCGLLGKNISYSLSPAIHNEYYKKNDIPLLYKVFDIEERNLDFFLSSLKENSIIGFNVTIPYKEVILKHIHILDDNARIIGAVNTVSIENNFLVGYNTDYLGFIESMVQCGYGIKNNNFLIIGSGGVARAVYKAALDENANSIDIASRNPDKVRKTFDQASDIIDILHISNCNRYDVIVNCTPLGGANFPKECPIDLKACNKRTLVYDLNYIPDKSILLKSAEKLGYDVINGISMLNNQALSAIKIWQSNNTRR